MPKFIIKTGKYQGKTLKLPERNITIGRELECDIRVADSDVSRKHCELLIRDGEMFVVDLNSRNGTCVNDIRIKAETPLQPGDQLRVGPMVFELAGTGKTVRKTINKPSNLTPETAAPLSDDDISNWLAEEVNETAPAPGDTTIFPTSMAPAAEPAPNIPPKSLKDRKEFHSVAEEAAEIIKKHWERVAQKKRENE
ncbi:MAG: FHA domain-containing protein [Planctomycetota bacterium]|uniref:FHA domain-containing protein n=1 Tax=uncultured Gimesia sp. TaxID=1678688 RepID=UPI00260D810B|nr:FHA domain-containing protein [uncultured Gimesia sp.]